MKHTADVKFRAYGKNLTEAFKNSAYALKETVCGNLKIKKKIKKEFEVKGKNKEALLYNFLEEFLFLLDAENFLLSKIKKIKILDNKLKAEVIGDSVSNYNFTNNVKAITYNEMFVKKQINKFICQVVLDV